MTRDPAAEPTGGEETDPRPAAQPPGEGGDSTVPWVPPSVPTMPNSAADADGYQAAVPSYGPPSYSQGYGPPAYGSGYGGYGGYGSGYAQPGMRAAATDRERTLDVLRAAYGEGRLGREEFESRTARTMTAKYYGELATIVADLPAGPMGPIGPQLPGYYPGVPVAPTNGLAVGSLVCSLIGLAMPLLLVPGLVMGHIARDQIRAKEQRGDGFAVAGLVFGYLGIAIWVLIIAVLVASHGSHG